MADLVFETVDRDAAHRHADKLNGCKCKGADEDKQVANCPLHGVDELAEQHDFECREDPNSGKPFQVWKVR